MSADIKAKVLTVALDDEYRDEGLKAIMDAIRMTKGVAKVAVGKIDDQGQWWAEQQARRELGEKLLEIVYPKKP